LLCPSHSSHAANAFNAASSASRALPLPSTFTAEVWISTTAYPSSAHLSSGHGTPSTMPSRLSEAESGVSTTRPGPWPRRDSGRSRCTPGRSSDSRGAGSGGGGLEMSAYIGLSGGRIGGAVDILPVSTVMEAPSLRV